MRLNDGSSVLQIIPSSTLPPFNGDRGLKLVLLPKMMTDRGEAGQGWTQACEDLGQQQAVVNILKRVEGKRMSHSGSLRVPCTLGLCARLYDKNPPRGNMGRELRWGAGRAAVWATFMCGTVPKNAFSTVLLAKGTFTPTDKYVR